MGLAALRCWRQLRLLFNGAKCLVVSTKKDQRSNLTSRIEFLPRHCSSFQKSIEWDKPRTNGRNGLVPGQDRLGSCSAPLVTASALGLDFTCQYQICNMF